MVLFKKAGAALLALILTAALVSPARAAKDDRLRFDENGEFRILVVADTQDTDKPQAETIAFLEAELDAAQPDLVVFLGDQIHGPSLGASVERTRKALDAILKPVAERGLKFAVIFGNHDDEGGVSKAEQMAYYQSYPGCLAVAGPEGVTGVGNYNLPVWSADGTTALCNLWFFDSGTYAPEGQGKYAWVQQDQLDWYLETCAALSEDNGGTPLPAYVFQHIIVPEIYDALTEVPASEKKNGAVEGFSSHSGHWYTGQFRAGELGEHPCPPDVNGGEFDAWLQGGDIVAAFFGHDHLNDFELTYEGIDFVNTNSTGFYIYGDGLDHGARLVTIREEIPGQYETKMLYYKDLIGTKLPFGFAGTWGVYVQRIVLLAVGALLVVLAGISVLVVWLVRRHRKKAAAGK